MQIRTGCLNTASLLSLAGLFSLSPGELQVCYELCNRGGLVSSIFIARTSYKGTLLVRSSSSKSSSLQYWNIWNVSSAFTAVLSSYCISNTAGTPVPPFEVCRCQIAKDSLWLQTLLIPSKCLDPHSYQIRYVQQVRDTMSVVTRDPVWDFHL